MTPRGWDPIKKINENCLDPLPPGVSKGPPPSPYCFACAAGERIICGELGAGSEQTCATLTGQGWNRESYSDCQICREFTELVWNFSSPLLIMTNYYRSCRWATSRDTKSKTPYRLTRSVRGNVGTASRPPVFPDCFSE